MPHWWGMFFTKQISCLPYALLITTSWYIGIDTLLYSLCFTNCIIPFLPQLSYHPSSLYLKLQPELLLKVITEMHTYFGIPDVAAKVAHSLDHLCMNSDNWIAIYNIAFLWYSA